MIRTAFAVAFLIPASTPGIAATLTIEAGAAAQEKLRESLILGKPGESILARMASAAPGVAMPELSRDPVGQRVRSRAPMGLRTGQMIGLKRFCSSR